MWITGAMIVLLKIASTSKPIFGETQCTVVFVVYFEILTVKSALITLILWQQKRGIGFVGIVFSFMYPVSLYNLGSCFQQTWAR